MKRLVIISSILTVVLVLGIMSIAYLHSTNQKMDIMLSEILYSCKQERDDNNRQKAAELTAIWEKRQPVLSLFIWRDELDGIDSMLSDLAIQLELGSFDGAYIQAGRIQFTLQHILEKEKPLPYNLL